MELKIYSLKDLTEKEINKIDNFINDSSTNGEFINSIKYLSYHPEGRFVDDSIVIKDIRSGTIKCVVMAAKNINDEKTIISHPGTTFAGPIINIRQSITEIERVLALMLEYYREKYIKIDFKLSPTIYSSQPMEFVEYTLLNKGFKFGMNALSNVIDLRYLKNEDNIFEMYDSKRRNQVKKSLKDSNYIFNLNNKVDKNIWECMNNNLNSKYDSKTTHSYEEIEMLQNKFPQSIIPYEAIRNDGSYGAYALVYKFKKVFHTQYLDLNYAYSNEYPNLFLIHNLIKTAINEGYSYFSFGASTENSGEYLNEGLYNYKAGFGGGDIILPVYKR